MKIKAMYGAGHALVFNINGSYKRDKVMPHILRKAYPDDLYTIYEVINPAIIEYKELDHFGVLNGKAIDSKKWIEENRKTYDEYKRTHPIECLSKPLTSYEKDFYF
jgi:hypothetical protein